MIAHAVILAGGSGERFWPLSTPQLPKQCLALDGERTLLQQTIDRLDGLVGAEQILVVTGRDMEAAVRDQLSAVPPDNVLVEPRGRNTAPAIAWAAVEVERRGGDAMLVLPADHRIGDVAGFRETLDAALTAARSGDDLVLVGCRPTHPHTGLGYIELEAGGLDDAARHVRRFVEKPDVDTATALIERGALWNAGIFAWTTHRIGEAIERFLPASAEAMAELRAGATVADVWDRFDATSIDYGVLERADNLVALQCDVGWSDLGSWTALGEVLAAAPLGAALVADGLCVDGGEHVVFAPGKRVATLGVSDLVIVAVGDTVLVCRKDQAQRVRELAALAGRDLPPES